MGTVASQEMIVTSYMRAQLCEAVATVIDRESASFDYFLLGMFSLLEQLLGSHFDAALEELPLSFDIASALRGEESLARPVLELVTAYERGEWEQFADLAEEVGLAEKKMPDLYLHAVQNAISAFSSAEVNESTPS